MTRRRKAFVVRACPSPSKLRLWKSATYRRHTSCTKATLAVGSKRCARAKRARATAGTVANGIRARGKEWQGDRRPILLPRAFRFAKSLQCGIELVAPDLHRVQVV